VHQWQGAWGPPGTCTCAASSSSSALETAQQQGAAAALVALVSVWLGARRVFVCLPDTGEGPASACARVQQQGPDAAAAAAFVEAFSAVVALNECSVVVERIRPKRWQLQQPRHVAALQREVLGVLGRVGPVINSGLVVVAACAAAGTGAAAVGPAAGAAATGAEQQLGCGSSSSSAGTAGCASGLETQQQLGEMFESLSRCSNSGRGVELLLYKSKC
jgi:hypothetical protein